MNEVRALPRSWSRAEVCAALHISPRRLDALIRDGRVGYYRAGRSRRFLSEHVEQITAALSVQPAASADRLAAIGATGRSAAAHRRSA